MAVTAGSIITNVQARYGDTNGDFITNALGLVWLTKAQTKLCEKTFPLTRWKGNAVSANQESFSVPADCIVMEVIYHAKGLRQPLKKISPEEFFQFKQSIDGAVGDPRYWTRIEERIYVWPRYASASNTTTVSGNATVSTTTTTVVVATIGQLETSGIVSMDSEDIQYTSKGASGTLGGVIRGFAGTTQAQHSSNVTVTALDFQMVYKRQPASMSATTIAAEIPDFAVPHLENYTLYLAYVSAGEMEKAQLFYKTFLADIVDADYPLEKETMGQTLRVRNRL